ncbi:MAG TPA: STAS domain-containing protein [Solirubrobacterales bacterium]|nr:STAS domain-containing protein [Solirubrobacterales bacterium]
MTDFKVHDGLLAVQQTSEGSRLRIAFEGEMDLANADTAAATLREALLCGKDVVVDLSKLEFLDSTGVAVLVATIREGGERLSFLSSEHDAVRRLLSLTGLEERMNFAGPMAVPDEAVTADADSLQPAA